MTRMMTRLSAMVLLVLWAGVPAVGAEQTADQTFQTASADFMHTYFQKWSSPNPVALSFMESVFPDQIAYFDKTVSHAKLLDAKRRFAERWPERLFVMRPDSLRVVCDAQHLCTVWGLVDWQCRSEPRHAFAKGTSEFSLQLQDGQTVVAEDGFVVTRGQAMPDAAPEVAASSDSAMPADKTRSPDEATASAPPGVAKPASSAETGADHQTQIYTNNDIPALRTAYFAQSSDQDWISDWLTAQKQFAGVARSLGSAGTRSLPDNNGGTLHYMLFDADQGPIACILPADMHAFPAGSSIKVHGTISIFIDQTMYLAHCSFA